jgi:hypothetical protein
MRLATTRPSKNKTDKEGENGYLQRMSQKDPVMLAMLNQSKE